MSNWIKGAIKRPGAFRAKAKEAGMGTADYARHVLAKGSRASERTKKQARLAQTLGRLRNRVRVAMGSVMLNTGWTDEARAASLAARRAKAAERQRQRDEQRQRDREQMFDRQRESGGRNFIENWYSRGRDGRSEDPHYGTPTPEAPYGYVEGTMEPRREPLYDRYGRPIIPRPWEDYHRPKKPFFPWQKDESLDVDMDWLRRVDEAENLWGRFGRKKRYFDQNPNATEEEWQKHDREQFEAWKRRKQEAEGVDSGTSGESQGDGGDMENRASGGADERAGTPGTGCLILNRETFRMPEDGWYQIAPLGEFPHGGSGVVQVVDRDACEGMSNRFREDAKATNFAGLLIDFDHFSLDGEKRSEAAGWLVDLENRDTGLWAKIRWSDVGEEAVKGGRYRFLSPVWARKDCVDLGNGRVRPVRLLNAAVTNDPNLKGMVPLSNSSAGLRAGSGRASRDAVIENAGGAQRFKWVLGDSPEGRHCPSCGAMAGQVHTMAEWDADGVKPGAGALYCQGNCHCRLEPTDEPTTGAVMPGPIRKEDEDVENREVVPGGRDVLANIGWTDEARTASLAVRRAKAAARRAEREGRDSGSTGGEGDEPSEEWDRDYEIERWTEAMEGYRSAAEAAFREEYGYYPTTPDEIAEAEELADVPEEYRTRGEETVEELATRLVDESRAERGASDDAAPWETDYLGWFEEEGMSAMTPEAVDGLTADIRGKLEAGEALSPSEEGFLDELTDGGYAGESDGDPIFQWQERQSMRQVDVEEATGMDFGDARARGGDLDLKESSGEALTEEERSFRDRYREIMGNRSQPVFLTNVGWTDEARAASLRVRRAKAATREKGKGAPFTPKAKKEFAPGEWPRDRRDPRHGQPGDRVILPVPPRMPIDDGGMAWIGGSPYFDERTGRYVYPPEFGYPDPPRRPPDGSPVPISPPIRYPGPRLPPQDPRIPRPLPQPPVRYFPMAKQAVAQAKRNKRKTATK